MLNDRLSDFRARNFTYPGSKGIGIKTVSLSKMLPLEWDGGWVWQTRSFDWKINEERTRDILVATWRHVLFRHVASMSRHAARLRGIPVMWGKRTDGFVGLA